MSAACTFFGHRECPNLYAPLYEVIEDLICNHDVTTFYVGNHGQFDKQVLLVLRNLKNIYPHIYYFVVLAYLPTQTSPGYEETLFPEGIECIPPKFAINFRNQWMLEHAEYVVTYITHTWGGAAKFAASAKAKRKYMIELA